VGYFRNWFIYFATVSAAQRLWPNLTWPTIPSCTRRDLRKPRNPGDNTRSPGGDLNSGPTVWRQELYRLDSLIKVYQEIVTQCCMCLNRMHGNRAETVLTFTWAMSLCGINTQQSCARPVCDGPVLVKCCGRGMLQNASRHRLRRRRPLSAAGGKMADVRRIYGEVVVGFGKSQCAHHNSKYS
jgi:hypothetical protein